MDFQTIVVFLMILAAVVYAGRRVFNRLNGFSSDKADCETGCGKCAAQPKPSKFAKL